MVSSLWSGLVWWLCCVARIGKPRSRTLMFFIHRTLVYSDDPVPVRSDWIPSTHFATLLQFGVVVGPTRPQRDDNACVWCLRQKGSLWCTCWDEDEEEWEWVVKIHQLVRGRRTLKLNSARPSVRTKENNERWNEDEEATCNKGLSSCWCCCFGEP